MVNGARIKGCGEKLDIQGGNDWGSWMSDHYYLAWEEELGRGDKNSTHHCGDGPANIWLFCGNCLKKAGVAW